MASKLELMRRWVEVFNTRDIEELIALCDQDIELHSVFAAVSGATYRGHDGMRTWHRELQETWGEEIRLDLEAYSERGADLLSCFVYRARGQHSGAAVAMPAASVSRWSDGLMTYVQVYPDRADALREFGIAGDEMEPIAP